MRPPLRRLAHVPYTLRPLGAHGTFCPLHPLPQPRSQSPSHGTSHRLGSTTLIPTSRVNHLLVRSAHRSIDERRCQVVCMTLIGYARRDYLLTEMEAAFGDVLCSLSNALLFCKK